MASLCMNSLPLSPPSSSQLGKLSCSTHVGGGGGPLKPIVLDGIPPTFVSSQGRRIVAVGDLHGDLTQARFALEMAGVLSADGNDLWTGEETIHNKKRNSLEHVRLNDLVFVKYNLALKRRFDMHDSLDPISLDSIEHSNEWLTRHVDTEESDELPWDIVHEILGEPELSHNLRDRATLSSSSSRTPPSSSLQQPPTARGARAPQSSSSQPSPARVLLTMGALDLQPSLAMVPLTMRALDEEDEFDDNDVEADEDEEGYISQNEEDDEDELSDEDIEIDNGDDEVANFKED